MKIRHYDSFFIPPEEDDSEPQSPPITYLGPIPPDLPPERRHQLAKVLANEQRHRPSASHPITTAPPISSGYPDGRWPLSPRNAQRQTKAKARKETQKLLANHPMGPPSTQNHP